MAILIAQLGTFAPSVCLNFFIFSVGGLTNGVRIDVFFMFHPHANRLFHIPTFLHSLALSPTHPKFPALPVLHAICAIGSLYTAAVTSPLPLDEIPAGTFTILAITASSAFHRRDLSGAHQIEGTETRFIR